MSLMDVPTKPTDFEEESRAISNSEVITYLSCKRMYNFAFIDNLAPKEEARQLTRGSLGHAWMQTYIEARLNGSSHELSLKAASEFLGKQLQDGIPIDLIGEVQMLCNRYMDYHKGWPEWELLGTEQRVDLRLTDTLILPIRYDLFIKHKPTGRNLIGDFKFTFDFWSYEDHALNPQMPKYISVMRANGFHVDGGFLEQIRTRKISDPAKLAEPEKHLWTRSMYSPSAANLYNTLRQHVAVSIDIERHRRLPAQQREDESPPVLNKYGPCRYCSFAELCIAMLEGKKDLTVDIRVGYTANTYGYNNQPEDKFT